MKQTLLTLTCIACLSWYGYGQEATNLLYGQVLSSSDTMPLPGASVVVKDTNEGVITDSEGRFRLKLDGQATLVISYIGYNIREVLVTSPFNEPLTVVLEENLMMLGMVEIVSTGYQDIPQERATGSFSTVDEELLNRTVSPDLMSRLQDVVPGLILNRGGSATDPISIRGRSTLFANASPLLIVDNFPYDGDISSINPNDIANITVLKDAAAASIWGARAGNGVIVITTKKGTFSQKPQVSFNTNFTQTETPDPFFRSQMSVQDFVDVERMLFEDGYYSYDETSPRQTPLTPVVELLIQERDGITSPEQLEAELRQLRSQDVRHDYEKYLYQPELRQQYNVGLSGGSSNHHYRFAAGYDRIRGSLVGNRNERYTMNAQNTWTLIKNRLTFTNGLEYVEQHTVNNGLDPAALRMSASSVIYPYAQLADEKGNSLSITHDYRTQFTEEATANGLLNWRYKPLEERNLIDNRQRRMNYRINNKLSFQLIDGLSADVLYQYWKSSDNTATDYDKTSYYVRDLINRFTQIGGDGSLSNPIPAGGVLDQEEYSATSHNLRTQLSFDRAWHEHQVSALAGWEMKHQEMNGNIYRYYGYDGNRSAIIPVDYKTSYSQYHYPASQSSIPFPHSVSSFSDRYLSYYINASYLYDHRYTFTGSARMDRSNLFGVKTNQKGVPLWSAGVAWNVTNEKFFDSQFLNRLKVRATYGHNGNIDKNITALTTATFAGTSYFTGLPYARITNPPNPELRWEKVKIMNFGLDIGLWNNRLNGSLEYYVKRGKDLIGYTETAPSTGMTEFKGNTAGTKVNGVDIILNSLNFDKQLQWQTQLIFSHVREEVVDYNVDQTSRSLLHFGDRSIYPFEGHPLFAVYSYRWGGLDPLSGDPQGYFNKELSTDYRGIMGNTTPDSLIYHGSARPTFFGALRNSFNWKGFSLSFTINYRLGYYFRNSSVRYSGVLSAQGGHGDYSKRWKKPGDEQFTHVPSMPDGFNSRRDDFYEYSEVLVEKGDHIRLQDIRLSYGISGKDLKNLPLGRVEVYLYAANLGVLWKASDAVHDPDYLLQKPLTSCSMGLKIDF